MTITFEEAESELSTLWDYGWFDVTRFRFTPSAAIDLSDADVIRELTTAPIYQRSFHRSSDPWGTSIGLHGPFHIASISPHWFQHISPDQLLPRISEAISCIDFPPTVDQMAHVNGWVDNVRSRGDAIFLMDAPDDERLVVEYAHIWFVFTEFICVNRNHGELTVAVIGYD
ncbi:MAG: hypothetical protein J5I65_06260 [Aridibacter famidurans]|nr:hypothetical protein [Aridibacter famidurans]